MAKYGIAGDICITRCNKCRSKSPMTRFDRLSTTPGEKGIHCFCCRVPGKELHNATFSIK